MGFTRNEVTSVPRGLLHLGSILACAGNPAIGGPFLWHYPSTRADWTLSSILPCGARTFLSWQQRPPAIVCQAFRTTLHSIQAFGFPDKLNITGNPTSPVLLDKLEYFRIYLRSCNLRFISFIFQSRTKPIRCFRFHDFLRIMPWINDAHACH